MEVKVACVLVAACWVTSVLSAAPDIDYNKVNKHVPAECFDERGMVITTGEECKKRFMFNKQHVTWHQAHLNCLAEDKQLACIRNRYEQAALEEGMVEENMGEVPMWLGATDQRQEGVYRCVGDGHAKMRYTNWAPREPNNLGNEHCAEMRFRYQWNDVDCNNRRGYICEYYGPPQE